MFDFLPWVRNSKQLYEKAHAHPANREILAYLRREATPLLLANVAPWSELSYGATVHPDLNEILDNAAKGLPRHYARLLLGFEVQATLHGVIFAIAISMSTLGFRLPEQLFEESLAAGAKPMAYIGRDWVEFDPWEPRVTIQERIRLFAYWCEKAYEHAERL